VYIWTYLFCISVKLQNTFYAKLGTYEIFIIIFKLGILKIKIIRVIFKKLCEKDHFAFNLNFWNLCTIWTKYFSTYWDVYFLGSKSSKRGEFFKNHTAIANKGDHFFL